MSKSQAISVAGLLLRVIQLSAVCLIAGCTAVPDKPAPSEYNVPLVTADGHASTMTVERHPGDGPAVMLFCIEGEVDTMCASDVGGLVQRDVFPNFGSGWVAPMEMLEPGESDREGI